MPTELVLLAQGVGVSPIHQAETNHRLSADQQALENCTQTRGSAISGIRTLANWIFLVGEGMIVFSLIAVPAGIIAAALTEARNILEGENEIEEKAQH